MHGMYTLNDALRLGKSTVLVSKDDAKNLAVGQEADISVKGKVVAVMEGQNGVAVCIAAPKFKEPTKNEYAEMAEDDE